MSGRGIKFREQWISVHVFWGMSLDGVPIAEDDEYWLWPRKLSDRCTRDARKHNIKRKDLEGDGISLGERMSQAMVDVADAELNRLRRPLRRRARKKRTAD